MKDYDNRRNEKIDEVINKLYKKTITETDIHNLAIWIEWACERKVVNNIIARMKEYKI